MLGRHHLYEEVILSACEVTMVLIPPFSRRDVGQFERSCRVMVAVARVTRGGRGVPKK